MTMALTQRERERLARMDAEASHEARAAALERFQRGEGNGSAAELVREEYAKRGIGAERFDREPFDPDRERMERTTAEMIRRRDQCGREGRPFDYVREWRDYTGREP